METGEDCCQLMRLKTQTSRLPFRKSSNLCLALEAHQRIEDSRLWCWPGRTVCPLPRSSPSLGLTVLGAEITKQRRHGLRVSQCGGVDRHINRQQQCSVIRAMIGVAKGALGTLRRE